jgi:hypothetical protein
MEILKDIEKSILNINMYSKDTEPAKLNLIKKQIGEYNKYKSDESNVIEQKIMKYDELYKNPRERNNYEYELFLGKKEELYNIYREAGTLDALYEYLNCKYDVSNVPDIYTYAHINLNERVKVFKDAKADDGCPEGKILNPKTKRCVKDPSYKKPKAVKEPKADAKEPKADAKEPKADAKEPKADAKEPKADAKEPKADAKEPKADAKKPKADAKEPKEPKEPKAAKADAKAPKVKECPEGKILNPKTNRCIKDPSYKKPKAPVPDPE